MLHFVRKKRLKIRHLKKRKKEKKMAKVYLDAYTPNGDLIAKCEPNDYGSALLMSLHGEGSTIRSGKKILWLEGADGEACESYDSTMQKVFDRLENR
jgi:hypothetical protein